MSKMIDMEADYSPSDAIAEVWYQFYRFSTTKDELNRADALIALSNAVSDLSSWHPRYNSDTGQIDGVFEE